MENILLPFVKLLRHQIFAFLFSGFDCSKISCSDCSTDLRRFARAAPSPEVLFHLQNSTFNENSNDPHAKEFYGSQSRAPINKFHLMECCSSMCKKNCTTSDGTSISDGTEWLNPNDSCMSYICNDGYVSTHVSLCYALPCPNDYRVEKPGMCCPTCNSSWASFCPEDEECDIACQFGFVVDHERSCDLCKCARRTLETSTVSAPAPTTVKPSLNDDASRTVPFYFHRDPTDAATKTLLIGLAVASGILVLACLVGIGWYFHRKVYKKVPLVSLRNSSA